MLGIFTFMFNMNVLEIFNPYFYKNNLGYIGNKTNRIYLLGVLAMIDCSLMLMAAMALGSGEPYWWPLVLGLILFLPPFIYIPKILGAREDNNQYFSEEKIKRLKKKVLPFIYLNSVLIGLLLFLLFFTSQQSSNSARYTSSS